MTKSPDAVTDGVTDVSVIHSLSDAWNDVNKQMEHRKMLLEQSVAFHSSAIQVHNSYMSTFLSLSISHWTMMGLKSEQCLSLGCQINNRTYSGEQG